VDASGNLYIADTNNNRIRYVSASTGVISTIAGTGTGGYTSDNVAATTSRLYIPTDVAVLPGGHFYIADLYNNRVRRVDGVTGIITTVAGTGAVGYNGDNIAATTAKLNSPYGIAFDASGNLYIGDQGNSRVRRVAASGGLIDTVAGTGTGGYSGDGGSATAAQIYFPHGVCVDSAGTIYITDYMNNRIRQVTNGVISTVAGTGINGYNGDGFPARVAQLNGPMGVTTDTSGRVYVAEYWSSRVRRLTPRQGADFTTDPMDGPTRTTQTYFGTVSDTNWEIRAVADFSGDGMPDLVWRNKLNGQIYYWVMASYGPESEIYVGTVDPSYDIVGTGDFDGDGKADLLWRHTTLGDVWIWLMDGPTPLNQVFVDRVNPAYVVKGVGDFDADLKADIVWHHGTTGEVWVWLMDGTTRLSQTWVARVPDTGYRIVAVADLNGDSKADLVWSHATRGEVWLWTMNGTARQAETWVGTVPDTSYQIAGTGDYNGDGKADLVWRNVVNGEVWEWLMNGPVRMSETWVATVPDTGYRVIR
jgi:hypothetical protein